MYQREELRAQILSQGPTEQQKEAIFAEEQEFLLRASPGSGKTWTSCRRFIWRAANWNHAAGGLALLSFTNSAIREFEQATIAIGGQRLLSDPNYVGTFDAFVERFILTPFGHLLNGSNKRLRLFTAPRPGDRANVKLQTWVDGVDGRKMPVYAWDIVPYLEAGKTCFRTSTIGGRRLDLQKLNPVVELMKLGYYTHSQRAYWAGRILFNRPYIADRVAARFPEIVVDEAQDTNMWLIVLLNFLRARGAKITLVGDQDQCIYSFAMADATSLAALKEKWALPEKPLSKSFRCNNHIASAVKNVGGNAAFNGRGAGLMDVHRAYILRENGTCADTVATFEKAMTRAGIAHSSSAILCRAHEQLQAVRGKVNYSKLQGTTKMLAEASFLRDCRKDYEGAFRRVEYFLRATTWDDVTWQAYDESPDAELSRRIRLEIWKFVRNDTGLPTIRLNGAAWISTLRDRLERLVRALGVVDNLKLRQKIQKKGLLDAQLELPLFEMEPLFPAIRHETIHSVKGESIDAVLVLGGVKFWNSVVSSIGLGQPCEDRRLAYVAMSRARDLLVVSLPNTHFDKQHRKWTAWGFETL